MKASWHRMKGEEKVRTLDCLCSLLASCVARTGTASDESHLAVLAALMEEQQQVNDEFEQLCNSMAIGGAAAKKKARTQETAAQKDAKESICMLCQDEEPIGADAVS